jgi:hypothetical protein
VDKHDNQAKVIFSFYFHLQGGFTDKPDRQERYFGMPFLGRRIKQCTEDLCTGHRVTVNRPMTEAKPKTNRLQAGTEDNGTEVPNPETGLRNL